MPRFTYTKHATIKMVERGLLPDAVEKVLLEADGRYVDTRHNIFIAVHRKEPPMVVAYRVEGDNIIVITVFSPENINKLITRRLSNGRWRAWSK